MNVTFGSFNPEGGDGHLAAVEFPSLMKMDEMTPDGRMMLSEGGGVRELPWTIKAQFETSYGHAGAVAVGAVHEVSFTDDGNVSARGWLADVPEAHHLIALSKVGALRQNSVDLADVEVELQWKSDDPASPDFWEYELIFSKWNIGTTTFVDIPAFPTANGEITASAEPVVFTFKETTFEIEMAEDEIMASGAPTVAWADFHIPETRGFTPITVDDNGRVFGHLAPWGKCHEGIEGRCVLAPRPRNYAAFCQPGVLTERGMVETGPIFFLGGHPSKPLGNGDRWAAYGGVENAWADVCVTNGVLGPWTSGRVRPGITSDAVYAARASRISGHWREDGTLAAIVSCNAAAYNVPGSGDTDTPILIPGSTMRADRDGARIENGRLVELVASLGHVPDTRQAMAANILSQFTTLSHSINTAGNTSAVITPIAELAPVEPTEPEFDYEAAAFEMELEIELDA